MRRWASFNQLKASSLEKKKKRLIFLLKRKREFCLRTAFKLETAPPTPLGLKPACLP